MYMKIFINDEMMRKNCSSTRGKNGIINND